MAGVYMKAYFLFAFMLVAVSGTLFGGAATMFEACESVSATSISVSLVAGLNSALSLWGRV
jgi:hypothetical protein